MLIISEVFETWQASPVGLSEVFWLAMCMLELGRVLLRTAKMSVSFK